MFCYGSCEIINNVFRNVDGRNVVDFIISKSSVTKKSQLEAVRVQRACWKTWHMT
jgi:hypothetical protein